MTFNDTQCNNYLLGALRHEPQWDTVASAITSSQIKGETTFRQACDELRLRCEAAKAYKLIDKEVKGKRKVQGYQATVVSDDSAEVSASAPDVDDAVKALISSVDSGAGQCICSCIGVFSSLRPCAPLIVGISGSLPVHGVGTANFLVKDGQGVERIWRIHNCLLCHQIEGDEDSNLLSVSRLLRTGITSISFGNDLSFMTVKKKKRGDDYIFPLKPDDGLYSVSCVPISENDLRFGKVMCFDVTPQEDPMMSAGATRIDVSCGMALQKSPSSLGTWTVNILWIGKRLTLAAVPKGFGEDLDDFCSSYIAPLSIPMRESRIRRLMLRTCLEQNGSKRL